MESKNIKVRLNYADVIRLQLKFYCFLNRISLSDNEIDCLTLLCSYKSYNLSEFCKIVSSKGIFKSAQSVRNFLNKAYLNGLVEKIETGKSQIRISERIDIKRKGDVYLKYEFLYASN